ncbi:MAG: RIP metalloprotease RseP [Streptococcaceae bacterium]|jgi:regulator of sigma E protease|nr:RIP metalloprotease RseP [Streptococcaceae bacterium]
MQILTNILVFILVFGVIVAVHEYGHLWWAKRAGILVREYAIGFGPMLFKHTAKDGTLYTIRMIPAGGYVRMAGWGDDETEIKKGQAASLVINDAGHVTRINLSEKMALENAIPVQITAFDFTDALYIEGDVFGETKRYELERTATIIEEDGAEVRIAPADVQYPNASVIGKLTTNFGGPLNNFILGLVAFIVLVFMQGGVASNTNTIGNVASNSPAAAAGLKSGDTITKIGTTQISNWQQLTNAITSDKNGASLPVTFERQGVTKTATVAPEKLEGSYKFGVSQSLKTDIGSKILGGFQMTLNAMTLISQALGKLFTHPSLNQLGGPVAIFQATGQAAQGGVLTVLGFLALLSINLGIVNLVPIPALDGGKIVLNLIEAIRRKPLKPEHEQVVTIAGAVFMIVLMIAVTWNDIMRGFIH